MGNSVIERYCELHGLEREEFAEHLLRNCLHAPARMLRPLLRAANPALFEPDLTYLSCVGRTRSLEQLQTESQDFRRDRANRSFGRRVLHLRVSVQRVHDHIAPLFS